MIPTAFEYVSPKSISEATRLLSQYGDRAKLLAGGHSLIPLMKLRLAQPEVLIDLGNISEMSYVRENNGGLIIGAMTTYYQLQSSEVVLRTAPVLAEAAEQVADPQVRNLGTIGGSLAHADPAGDLPAVAIALNAQLVTSSTGEHRTISSDDFFVDLFTTALQPNEVLSEIRIPALPPGTGTAYFKFANKASHYAIVGVAATVNVDTDGVCQNASIGITGAGIKAVRATETEKVLTGSKLDDNVIRQASQNAVASVSEFMGDVHASAEYREHLLGVYAERAIRAATSASG